MARRILNRKDLRADFEAAERRKTDDDEEDEDEAEETAEAEAAEAGDADDGDGEEEAPPKKKKKAPAVKEPKPRRSRAAKVVRQKVVWGVFSNSNQRVATFDYPKKQDAEEHAAKLKAESKTNQTYFVQPVKEPIEEK
jgi:hypothetical protein